MKTETLIEEPKKAKTKYDFFMRKNVLRKIGYDKDLVKAHLDKSSHNMMFFDKNSDDSTFNDWLIVTLYYALYHAALSLIAHKGYTSSNHSATLVFLLVEYYHLKDDVRFIDELSIQKQDAQLYTELKSDRHQASYQTTHSFTAKTIEEYRERVIHFIQKAKSITRQPKTE